LDRSGDAALATRGGAIEKSRLSAPLRASNR